MNFPDKYDHKTVEQKWQKYWQDNGVYHWQDDKPRSETFVIDTPPPTVSGILHMGHVFSYTQADFIARYQRMSGKDVFYPMGFDDNGLPTERLVEKEKKIRATDLSREDFIKVCEEVVAGAETEFEKLFNSIALSVDWRQKYETISDRSRKISQSSFLDLYNKGEVYRRYQPMFWDPVDQTAIAQAEVVDKDMESAENYLLFGIDGSDEKIEIMTTRPEMLAACVAVMVHPNNKKYIGKTAVTPLFGAKVPIIADELVDEEKGTGFVMCCTFGDETDIKWWQKHNLDMKIILNKYGKLDLPDHAELNGKKANKETRELIMKLLAGVNAVAKESKKISHVVKTAERSGAPLEIIPTYQWFVKLTDKKDKMKEKINECRWYPEYMKVRAEQWNESLSWDWCISRQRYFGVPFPVWYKLPVKQEADGHYTTYHGSDVPYVARTENYVVADVSQLPVNPLTDVPKGYEFVCEDKRELCEGLYKLSKKIYKEVSTGKLFKLIPDPDVMDTWATSSVSPQLSSWAWVDKERHAKLFPADLRPQAHEIIRTWAYYTIAKALLHENTVPWKNLMISGWCLAEDKSKMSKSKGNVITPVPLVESKSSDVVRYWTSTSSLGADTAYSEDVLKIGAKLVNKLWNASKFASINLSKLKSDAKVTETLDKWIVTRLNKTIKEATANFEIFEYSKARVAIEEFFWKDFCDNYLEFVKTRSYDEKGESPQGQQSALKAISICIDHILRLWAPFVPHITEELHNIIFGAADASLASTQKSIHSRGTWPKAELLEDEAAEKVGIEAVAALEEVRKFKSEKGVSIKFPIKELKVSSKENLKSVEFDLKSVTSAENVLFSSGELQVGVILGDKEAA